VPHGDVRVPRLEPPEWDDEDDEGGVPLAALAAEDDLPF
jgi:hypothetical protein